jgi:protocatechuate 3,4-dioxygenase beta subunit
MRFSPILLCVGLLAAQTQPAAQDLCRVEGTVLNSVTGEPVPRVPVTLWNISADRASGGAASSAQTNAEGKFVFAGLAAGAYAIRAQRDNFQYIEPKRSGPLTLNAGDQKTDLVVQITPLGAIAGHVRNEEGDALPHVQVMVMVYGYTAQGRQLVTRNMAQTNDLGEYRIFELGAGKYFLSAGPPMMPAGDETYVTTYYPGVTDPSGATAVDLGAGQDMRGMDFTLRRVHGASVRGHVAKPAALDFLTGVIVQAMASGSVGGMAAGPTDAEGRFELRGLTPGAYTLTAQAAAGGKQYRVRRPIQVGAGDVEGIELTLAPPVDLDGVVRIEGDTSVKPSQVHVSLMASPMGGGQAMSNNDGTFTIRNLAPEVYRPIVNAPGGGLFLKSVRCGTADVTESGVDLTSGGGCELAITMSANGGQVEGQVQDDKGQPAQGAMVTLLAVGTRRDDLFKVAGADASGHFKIAGIAPGSYRLFAWEQGTDFNAVRYDPDYVKPFEGSGQSVQVSDGGKESVSLKVIVVPAEQ